MTAFHRNSYIKHMYEFTRQPLKIFDCIDFFYNELDVEESKEFINPTVQAVTETVVKDYGMGMHNGCMPMRLTIINLDPIMKVVTFDDKHIKKWKKDK